MNTSEMIAQALHLRIMRGGIPQSLRAEEAQAGRAVVKPGEVPWLSTEEWKEDTVVSIEGYTVRLILLVAVRPGHGAFTRLIARLRRAGLKPAVVAPMPPFAAALERRGWRSRIIGTGYKAQEVWYPRRRA